MKTISSKVLVIFLVAFVLAEALVIVFSITKGFSRLEEEFILRDLDRFSSEINSTVDELSGKTADWGAWDETYQFAINRDSSYIIRNLMLQTFQNISMNFIAIVDKNNKLILCQAVDLQKKRWIPIAPEFAQTLSSLAQLRSAKGDYRSIKGLIDFDLQPMAIACRPILSSSSAGPSVGTIMLGKFIDTEELSKISYISGSMTTLPQVKENRPDLLDVLSSKTPAIEILNTSISAYEIINDITNNPYFLIATSEKRKISAFGRDIVLLCVCMFLGIIIILLAFSFLFKKKILQTRKKLKLEELRFSDLTESLPQIVFEIDNCGRLTYVNKIAWEILRYPPYKLPDNFSLFDALIEDHRDNAKIIMEELLKGICPKIKEFRFLRLDKTTFPGIIHATTIISAGRVIGLRGIVFNIEELRTTQDELAREKELLQVTLLNIGEGVIATDVSCKVTLVNQKAEEITGYSLNDFREKKITELFQTSSGSDEDTSDPKRKFTGSFTITTKKSNECSIESNCSAILNAEKNLIGYVLTFRDTTEKQKLEAEAVRAQKLESIGLLAGGIAHDFNNLLSGIFTNIELAKEQSLNNEEISLYLNNAMNVFSQARNLTEQLLTFSKGNKPQRKTVHIGTLLRNAVSFTLAGSKIKERYDIAHDVYQCDVDYNQICQVIQSIVLNAKQAMNNEGTLTIKATNLHLDSPLYDLKPGDYVSIEIIDTGSGISNEIISKIFDPFFTTKEKSSGLGLATSYSIVKKHDGHILVSSEKGKGTVFMVILPATKMTAIQVPSPMIKPTTKTNKILIMDDKSYVRDVMKMILERAGFRVECAAEGQDAVIKCVLSEENKDPFHIAILDLTIPGGMGGTEAAVRIRSTIPEILLLASSGYSDDPVMSSPAEYGFDGIINKPFTKSELMEAIYKCIPKVKSVT